MGGKSANLEETPQLTSILLLVILIILGVTFCYLNQQEISLSYLFGWETRPFPLFLLIIAFLLGGLAVGFSIGWKERWSLKSQTKDLGKKLQALRQAMGPLPPKEVTSEPSRPTPPAKELLSDQNDLRSD